MPSSTPTTKSSTQRPTLRWRSLGAVFAGGLLGSGLRFLLGEIVANPGASQFPRAVLIINLVGSFSLGWYLARRERAVERPGSTRFWAIGVFGSFTTFSAFSAGMFVLVAGGHLTLAGVFLGLSVVGGLVLALIGQRIGRIGVR